MIVRRALRDDWWKVLAYLAILAFNVIVVLRAYPTFEANLSQLMNLMPDFLSFVAAALLDAGEQRLQVFMGINHFFKGANMIGPAAAIILALGTVVREVEIGTIGLLLSRPISRTRILLSFAAVHLLELILPLTLVTVSLPLLADCLIDRQVELLPFLWANLHASAFIGMVYALSLLIAVLLNEQIKVAAVAGGVCIISFMLYFIDATRPFTLYRLSSLDVYVDIVKGGPLPLVEFSVCLGAGAACLAGAILVFREKDY
ncbi:MAG: ABC transporter permease subunit [Planctomycetes bacterium]|nr:ABC transporter permease subunit [Planctomycetota bacterium]